MNKNFWIAFNKRGMSLVEVLIVVGVMAILASGFASMMVSQQNETKALSEKLAALDLERLLINTMANGSSCIHLLKNPTPLTFDASIITSGGTAIITPSLPLYANVASGVVGPIVAEVGKKASSISDSLIISTIQLKITAGANNTYLGNWEIGFDSSKLVRSVHPVSVATLLTIDNTTPTAATITTCNGNSGGSPTTPTGAGVWHGYEDLIGKEIDTNDMDVSGGAGICAVVRIKARVNSAGLPELRWISKSGMGCTINVDSGWQPGEMIGGAHLSPGGLSFSYNNGSALAVSNSQVFYWP